MNRYRNNKRWVIWFSFLITIFLEQIPWPNKLFYYKPTLLLLVLIYWVMNIPHGINVCSGFVLGILMDVIQGSAIGIHALAYSIVCYLVAYNYHILRNITIWQQSLIIIIISIIMNFTIIWGEFISSNTLLFKFNLFYSCLMNAILWPLILLVLKKIKYIFLIN